MAKIFNFPTVQYCVEGTMPGGDIAIERFLIQQVEVRSRSRLGDHPNYNTVQRYLSELSKKTGLDYRIVRWGDVWDCSGWLAGAMFNE